MPNILVQKPSNLNSMDTGGTVVSPPQLLLPVKKPVIVKPISKPVVVAPGGNLTSANQPVLTANDPGQNNPVTIAPDGTIVTGTQPTDDQTTTGEKARNWLQTNWPWLAGAVGVIVAGLIIWKLWKK